MCGRYSLAVTAQELAERFGLPADQVKRALATLEAQPQVTRELLLRRIVEAWLAWQRGACGARGTARESQDNA